MRLFSNKPSQAQIVYTDEQRRQKAAQKHLDGLIEDICEDVGVCREKYTSEKTLLLAILKKPEARLNSCWKRYAIYDNSYRLLKELGVKVDAKYAWFTNIKEHILQIKPN